MLGFYHLNPCFFLFQLGTKFKVSLGETGDWSLPLAAFFGNHKYGKELIFLLWIL